MKECGDVYYYVKELLIKLSVLSPRNVRNVFTKRRVEGVTFKVVAGRNGGGGNILNMGLRHVILRDNISSVI
jgi:hypothetical protein